MRPQDLLIFTPSPELGLQEQATTPVILYGCFQLDSGPHACVTSTLLTELLPHIPCMWLFHPHLPTLHSFCGQLALTPPSRLPVPGCHPCGLHVLLRVPHWTAVPGSHQRLRGAWLRSVHSNLHSPPVLLLRRMAQGSAQSWCPRHSRTLPPTSKLSSNESFMHNSKVGGMCNSWEMWLLLHQG